MKKTMFGLLLIVVFFAGPIFLASISYRNTEVRLRNEITAQQEKSKLVFDKVWKVIQQKAQVTDAAKDAFKEIYVPLMEKRYETGGAMMKWVQEQNPQFDQSMYKDLMNSIEALRNEFQTVQTVLLDQKREHDNLRTTIPSKWFLRNVTEIKLALVTSGATDEAFQTGHEDNVDVFGKAEKNR